MSKTTEHIIKNRNMKTYMGCDYESNPFTIQSFFDSFSLKEEYKNLLTEDLENLWGYYGGGISEKGVPFEKLKNGEKGICIDKQNNKVTIVHCSGNDGSYTHTVLTLGELKHLVNIFE